MSDLFQFVDSISATPTVRLNLSTAPWLVHRDTRLGPPPMKRSVMGTFLRDGDIVGSTAYGNRELQMVLLLQAAGNDALATELQKLARELDRERNIVKWQPEGATQPVFFRTYRSSPDEIFHDPDLRTVNVTIPAEPFALGLREDVGPAVITCDPAAVTNPLRFDLSGVKGDVEVPLLLQYTGTGFITGYPALHIGVRPTAAPYPTVFKQAEAFTMGTDATTLADATFSGGSKVRVSFATNANMTIRLQNGPFPISGVMPPEYSGSYRVYGRFAQTQAADVIKVLVGGDGMVGFEQTLISQTAAQVVELGKYYINSVLPATVGYGSTPFSTSISSNSLLLSAQRVSGSGSLDIDYITLIPADYRFGTVADMTAVTAGAGIIDSIGEAAYPASDPFGTPARYPGKGVVVTGGFPSALPGDNRVHLIHPWTAQNNTDAITQTISVTCHYWPRYVHVRPPTT